MAEEKTIITEAWLELQAFIIRLDEHRLLKNAGEPTTVLNNDQFFQETIDWALKIKLFSSTREMADKMAMSRPTLERWRDGKSVPHPALRPRNI